MPRNIPSYISQRQRDEFQEVVQTINLTIPANGVKVNLPNDATLEQKEIYGLRATVGGTSETGVTRLTSAQAQNVTLRLFEKTTQQQIEVPLIHLVEMGNNAFFKTYLKGFSTTKSEITVSSAVNAATCLTLSFIYCE